MNLELFERQDIEKQSNMIQTGIREFSQKTYTEVSTDEIVKSCGISKGLLFHYFGSKKDYYLYCLEQALKRLVEQDSDESNKGIGGKDFHQILFKSMEDKMQLSTKYPEEMHFVNMASREMATAVDIEKTELIQKYMVQRQMQSAKILQMAVQNLPLKEPENKKIAEYLLIYTNAIISKYLVKYQNTPDEFFLRKDEIMKEMKEGIDCMLYGIVNDEYKQ